MTKGGRRALDGVSLRVASGEVVALLGPNGAGKTTLLQLLAGVEAPDAGTITIAGRLDPTRPNVRARLGFAPQSNAVYDELTVEENLRFFALLHGVSRTGAREAVDRGLVFSGLHDRRKARASTLSGGMRRRLHVAATVVHAPNVILLDEPLVGVDEASCAHLVAAIGALRDAGAAIVWSTHDRAPIDALGARPVRLAAGRIVE